MGANDKSLTVKYKPNHTCKVWIMDGSNRSSAIEMDGRGTITFEREANASWVFPSSGAFSIDGDEGDFHPTVSNGGATLSVVDDDSVGGTYNYTLTIDVGGTLVPSDPQIINKTG